MPGANLEGAFGGGGYAFPRSTFVDGYYFSMQSASFAYIWQTQPHVPTVIGYLAREFAQVSLRLHEDNEGTLGAVDYNHPAAQSARWPTEHYGEREWRLKMATDYFLYGNAYSVIIRPPGADKATLLHIPAYAMGVRGANRITPDGYVIIYASGDSQTLGPEDVIHWRGPNSLDPRIGWSPMEQLRDILIEESTRRAANIEFNRGGRVKGGVIERPVDAPEWSNQARGRFEEGWANKAKGMSGGKSPVLEDGMTWKDAGVTPKEAENLAASTASLATVANLFGLHPDLFAATIGQSDLDEARKQVMVDVLPAHMALFAEALTLKLVRGTFGETKRVFAFDLSDKLDGEEDKIQKLVGASGRPVLTVNESRARLGLEPKEGGNELVIPSNVIQGGKPSTNVMPVPDPNSPAQDGSHREGDAPAARALHAQLAKALDEGDEATARALLGALAAFAQATQEKSFDAEAEGVEVPMDRPVALTKAGRFDQLEEHDSDEWQMKAMVRRGRAARRRDRYASEQADVIRRHFERQQTSLAKGAGLRADNERWNKELATDLYDVMAKQVTAEGEIVAERLMGEFDPNQTVNYLTKGARAAAEAINATTQQQLMDARASLKADDPDAIARVWEVATTTRADELGRTGATRVACFAAHEAGRQNPGQPGTLRVKEWVWGGSAGSRHEHLAGEVTPINGPFSNGMQFPGDPDAPSTDTTNCSCSLDVY